MRPFLKRLEGPEAHYAHGDAAYDRASRLADTMIHRHYAFSQGMRDSFRRAQRIGAYCYAVADSIMRQRGEYPLLSHAKVGR